MSYEEAGTNNVVKSASAAGTDFPHSVRGTRRANSVARLNSRSFHVRVARSLARGNVCRAACAHVGQ